MKKNYGVSVSYEFETLDEAVKFASRRAVKNMEDYRIWQAVKVVSAKAPEVDVTDVTL